jgi:hypothetical protein
MRRFVWNRWQVGFAIVLGIFVGLSLLILILGSTAINASHTLSGK